MKAETGGTTWAIALGQNSARVFRLQHRGKWGKQRG